MKRVLISLGLTFGLLITAIVGLTQLLMKFSSYEGDEGYFHCVTQSLFIVLIFTVIYSTLVIVSRIEKAKKEIISYHREK